MARAQGSRAQMALAFETVYGTPPPAGAYWKMPFASASLGSEQPLLASELLGYGRDPVAPVLDAITADGDVVVPIDARCFGIWLKGAFGEPATTGSAGAFSHEFHSGLDDLPSMAIEIGMPEVPHFGMVSGAMVNSLSWTMSRSGLITATVSVIGQGEETAGASAAGTATALPLTRFGAFAGAVKRNGAQLGNIVSAEITYTNNLDRIETIRADGKIDGADPGLAGLSGTVEVRFADRALIDQAVAGAPCELVFSYEISPEVAFMLTAHEVFLPRPRLPIEGPGGVQASFAWQGARDEALGRMATAVLKNDVADYDNP